MHVGDGLHSPGATTASPNGRSDQGWGPVFLLPRRLLDLQWVSYVLSPYVLRGHWCAAGFSVQTDNVSAWCERIRIDECDPNCPAGNPILPMAQEKLERVVDFSATNGLSLERHYRSVSRAQGALFTQFGFGRK